jgi:hypothetical protein
MQDTKSWAILCAALLIAQRPYTLARPQPPPNGQEATGGSQIQLQNIYTPAQLESLVAPIALYPDTILSQALVASTYPLEVVEAGRWLKQNSTLKGKELADAATKQTWDASVQALVLLPDVLNRLDQDVGWTSDLGNAFLADQQNVMDAVQRMRVKAKDTGALQSTPQQTVSTATVNNTTYIEIQQANPEVVYVPVYTPAAVWGPPPPDYPYPPVSYPPSTGAISAGSALSFGTGIAVGAILTGAWGWACGWTNKTVIIHNNFINANHLNHVNVANGNNWVHNPAHRAGVPYSNRTVANRFGIGGGNLNPRPTAAQTQQRFQQVNPGQRGSAARSIPGNPGLPGAAATTGQLAPGQRTGSANRVAPGNPGKPSSAVGNRSIGVGSPATNRGAFGAINQGGNRTRMNSIRVPAIGGSRRK